MHYSLYYIVIDGIILYAAMGLSVHVGIINYNRLPVIMTMQVEYKLKVNCYNIMVVDYLAAVND